jgi:hypothetical protein
MCPHTSILLPLPVCAQLLYYFTTLLLYYLTASTSQILSARPQSPPCLPPSNLLLLQYVIYYLHPTRHARALHALPEILQECLHLPQGGRCVCEDEKGPPKSRMQKVVCI